MMFSWQIPNILSNYIWIKAIHNEDWGNKLRVEAFLSHLSIQNVGSVTITHYFEGDSRTFWKFNESHVIVLRGWGEYDHVTDVKNLWRFDVFLDFRFVAFLKLHWWVGVHKFPHVLYNLLEGFFDISSFKDETFWSLA